MRAFARAQSRPQQPAWSHSTGSSPFAVGAQHRAGPVPDLRSTRPARPGSGALDWGRRADAPAAAPASIGIRAKLIVAGPGDAFEQEADRVAERVLRSPGPPQEAGARKGGCAAPETVPSGAPASLRLRRVGPSDHGRPAAPPVPSVVHDVLRSPGQPLDGATRSFMEPRFGHDFGHVRVHADARAAESARALGAQAYTVGRDLVFGAGRFAPGTGAGRRLLAHELAHVLQQASGPAAEQAPAGGTPPPTAAGARVIQRQQECHLEPVAKECDGAAGACATVKDYCATKYPKPQDIETLHANAVRGATSLKEKFPHAADNLLHFLRGSGKEKVMPIEVFKNHPQTQQKHGEHMARFLEGARKRYEAGTLKIGGPAVEMVWTDTASAFTGDFNDLGLAVGGYTLCSRVSAKAMDPKAVGGSPDLLWVRLDPWAMQAFDCYNWDPGKGIGLAFATDNDLCCLENAGRAKHFRVRTDPWSLLFPVESVRLTPPAGAKEAPPPPAPPAPKSEGSR